MIYIITFIISLFFIKIANNFKNNKFIFYFFSAIGILIPCFLAAFRDLTIGTDVNVYISPLFNAAKRYDSFVTYINSVSINDKLYLLLTYICANFSNSIGVLLFIIHLLVILPIYISLERIAKKTEDVLLGMYLFFMFLNNTAFNMARQSIALSFCILALTFLEEKKYKSFFLFVIVAIMFHTSATFMILIFLIYWIITTNKIKIKIKKVFKIFFFCALSFCVVIGSRLIPMMRYLGFEENKIELYSTKYLNSSLNFSLANTLFYTFVFILIYANRKKLKELSKNYDFYNYIALISILLLQLAVSITYADRISYYLFYPIVFLILPHLSFGKGISSKNALFINILIICAFAFYWWFWIVLLKYHATYPYIYRRIL